MSTTPFRVVDLEPMRVTVAHRVPMDSLQYDRSVQEDHIWGDLEFRLSTEIATQTIERHEFRAPLNWWEAVKERFAPEWFLRRYPVRYRTETVSIKAEYPGITIPKHQHRFRMHVNDQPLFGAVA